MRRATLGDLSEVFVPFETVKTNKGKVIYRNVTLDGGLGDAELLSRYNYVTLDGGGSAEGVYDKRVFFAERYGGDGILNNGGGARCGFDGRFQLKGVGVNKLLGVRSPDVYGNSHANGFLCLNIALYESIWAEVIQIALPYGAVSTVGIIDLEAEFEEENVPHARALLVRLPVVRPAHFIRAMYFKEKKYDVISEDAKRVSAALRKLASFLPGEKTCHASEALSDRLSVGMVELAIRYANQFATARSKRIYHSNVSASNITIDGAWLDLSRSTVFSERLWWDGFDLNNFKEEFVPAINSIREICFYLSKCGVISSDESGGIFEKVRIAFSAEYERTLSVCNAVQVGFPLCIIKNVTGNPAFLKFSQSLIKVLAKDKYNIVPVFAGSWVGYEHGVSRLYRQLLKGKCNNEVVDLSWFSEDRSLLSELVVSYGSLFDLVVSEARIRGVARSNLVACVSINLTRLNRFNSVLVELNDEIVDAIRNSAMSGDTSCYRRLFERSTLASSQAFKYDEEFELSVWEDESVVVKFEALTGRFIVEDKKDKTICVRATGTIKYEFARIKSMFCFYENSESVFL